jgi:outer membrane protein TolC
MWFRSAILATFLTTSPIPAVAQSQMSDQQKWKALLPAVRAATDCIARQIAANPQAAVLARQEQWSKAVSEIGGACATFVRAAEAQYDRLHGSGTGYEFLKGPYLSDLPRALAARLRPVFAKQDAEVAAAEQARKNQEAEINAARAKVLHEAVDAHYECVRNAAADFIIHTNEGAEAITTAALVKCSQCEVFRAEQNQATGRRKFRPLRRPMVEALARRKLRGEKPLRSLW